MNTHSKSNHREPSTTPDSMDPNIKASRKRLGDQADIPDGPNVAPSPFEHLAAQGQSVPGEAGSDAVPAGTQNVKR